MAHRFFVPAEWLQNDQVQLKGQVARQIARVLRMSPGDQVVLLDNSGTEYVTELRRFSNDAVEGHVVSTSRGQGEPNTHIVLHQALLKGDKFEWVLQKGTELGVSAFVPLLSRRSVPQPQRTEGQHGRWTRIVTEAAEQSGRALLPEVRPVVTLEEACKGTSEDLALMPWEAEEECSLRSALGRITQGRVSLFIGPEGGWDAEEVALARDRGILPVTMGRRILRAETAAIAAITVVMYSRGGLDR